MTTDSERVNRTDPSTVTDQADRILVSFRSPETDPDDDKRWWVADSEWLQESMTEATYLRYLRWAHAGPVSVGDEWDEFVNCGCASPQDVVLRVERVEGGTGIGGDTTIDVVSRKAVLEADDAGAM
ncbi:hypothetical protein ACFQJ5_01010 [Halomicroarcula sp. GCM10025324]|uniref:hypothetical protein n=1 Tax=Haloarcula TaxID=2237 RepID=UPI0023E895A8|nr:hypothetical protein [Halomicroarcula sp. ZS-22-S1]